MDESRRSEPAYKTRIIDNLNNQCAKKKKGLFLRTPRSPGSGDCIRADHTWTEEESKSFFADGRLPRDLSTTKQDSKVLKAWLFEGNSAGGELPELELDPMPDFEKYPALCVFDVGVKGQLALIPSKFLRMVPPGGKKVRFELDQQRLSDQSVPKGDGERIPSAGRS